MPAQAYRRIADLPETVAIFPLSGALLLPRWQLPLNIFEPRYLNMIDDAMATTRIIGMIQTTGGLKAEPRLAQVGCAGRITSFSETPDGRYLITLTGISRFAMAEELEVSTPYRQAKANWEPFASDLASANVTDLPDREAVIAALRHYIDNNKMDADWSAVEEAPIETLVNALCAGCPFEMMEKQALLEAASLRERAETLIALLEMDMPGTGKGSVQ